MKTEETPKIEEADATGTEESTDRAAGNKILRIPLDAAVWVGLAVASVILLVVLGFTMGWPWPLQQKPEDAEQSAKDAARDGTVAVYTYSADTLDRDIASAQSHLTGDFLSQYQQYVQSPAPSEAKKNAVKTAATVVGAAVKDLRPGSADVLLFINQTTTTAQNPATTMASRSILVTLLKVDGKWLISSLKPV